MRFFGLQFLFCTVLATPSSLAVEDFQIQALTEESKPLQFIQDHRPSGFAVDLVEEILVRSPLQGRIEIMPWARAYKIALEEPNVLLFSTRRTIHREEKFQWASPLYIHNLFPNFELARMHSNSVLLCNSDAKFKLENIEQAKQHTIAAQRGDYLTEYIIKELNWPVENILFTRDYSDVIKLLEARRTELAIMVNDDYKSILQARGFEPENFKPCFEFERPNAPLYFSFSLATDDKIVTMFSDELEKLYDEGRYLELFQKWFAEPQQQ